MGDETCDHDLSASSRKVIHDVTTFGWHVMKVTAASDGPDWAFSIGLFHTFAHPEILMFGLSFDTMHRVINAVGESVRAGGSIPAESERDDLLEGYRCMFKPVDVAWYGPVLGYATWYYQGSAFPTLQCFWPDREQRYPWAPNFDMGLVSLQPLLFHADPAVARAQHLAVSP